eukprot:g57445.t1
MQMYWLKLILLLMAAVEATRVSPHVRRALLGKSKGSKGKVSIASKDAKDNKDNKDNKDGSDYTTPARFHGVLRAITPTRVIYQDTPGYMNFAYGVPMKSDAVFPIGSNTKLLTAISIYQLQEAGHFDVNDDVAAHLDQTDFAAFGHPEVSHWCPVLYGDTNKTCQKITFVNLMAMNSGLIVAMNCPYERSSPFAPYCNTSTFFIEVGHVADVVGGFILDPLEFKPGSQYAYSNHNFILLTYLIEKYSGLNYGEYLQKNIFDPIGLRNSRFDRQNGRFGVIKNRVDEYHRFYDRENNYEQLALGDCRNEFEASAISGTGGALSTQQDIAKLYFTLFNPKTMGTPLLSKNSWFSLIGRHQPSPQSAKLKGQTYFSQGVVTYYEKSNNTLPTFILYEGGMACAFTANILDLRPDIGGPFMFQAWRNEAIFEITKEQFDTAKNAKYGLFEDYVEEWGEGADVSAVLPVAFNLLQQVTKKPVV